MDEEDTSIFQPEDHRAAFIFTPATTAPTGTATTPSRPAKRRRVTATATGSSKKTKQQRRGDEAPDGEQRHTSGGGSGLGFPRLLSGKEGEGAARLREELFEGAWGALEGRIQDVLRKVNGNTLDEVSAFVKRAGEEAKDKIPAGFIITGPNLASQDLLFEQLAETLGKGSGARVVRLRSAEAPNLKAALKKIIREAATGGEDTEEAEVSVGQDGRKYLDYDLEALHVSLKMQGSREVVVAFQDSEAFDNGLLMDLVALFHSWHDRIQFSVLFGIATSVELFQARLLKSTARRLYGAQFDVVQAGAVLETVFKTAVAGNQSVLRIGPSLLRSLVDRQHDQVAGVQVFISSLKYAYMCHFYANPLSISLADETQLSREVLQPEYFQAVRTLQSFQTDVEDAVEAGQLSRAKSLLQSDDELLKYIVEERRAQKAFLLQLLRSLHLISASGLLSSPFTDLYISALDQGIDVSSEIFPMIESIRKLGAKEILTLVEKLQQAIQTGSTELDLPPWEADASDLMTTLSEIHATITTLSEKALATRKPLKSKYTTHGKVLRTTVVAQKVQLSHDTATLTEQDKAFTAAIDRLTDLVSEHVHSDPLGDLPLHEAWVYDSKSPYRDVFIPRPGTTFERALGRPHDYLSCACCGAGADGTVAATYPTTAILYRLYQEAGALINVADLWTSYYALVGDESEVGMDERTALVCFYRGLAEMKAMGFVKQSKKKADHVAKVKWL
ncbi:origin recognition complex subunit 3 N-terminus-domain-containing protein [Podospora conica]|nr:origin recognition complex subunit 3 N-terminus-domain-containing protein [Schizothecium conicum]